MSESVERDIVAYLTLAAVHLALMFAGVWLMHDALADSAAMPKFGLAFVGVIVPSGLGLFLSLWRMCLSDRVAASDWLPKSGDSK